MTREQITDISERYGLERILEDAYIDVPFVLEILNELGYIHLEAYADED